MSEQRFWKALYMALSGHDEMDEYGALDWIEPKRYIFGTKQAEIRAEAGFLESIGPSTRLTRVLVPGAPDSLDEFDWTMLAETVEAGKNISVEKDGVNLLVVIKEDYGHAT